MRRPAVVPLLSSIDVSTTEVGDFYFNFTAEVHEINDPVGGTKEIKDQTRRERSTLSQVISVTDGLTDNWSVSGLVSYAVHR